MSRRARNEKLIIEDIVRKYGLMEDDLALADRIAKALEQAPLNPRNIRRYKAQVWGYLFESKSIRLESDENIRYFQESISVYEDLRRRAMKEMARSQAISTYRFVRDEKSGKLEPLRDAEGRFVVDKDADWQRNAKIDAAHRHIRDAQYQIDRLLKDSGNRVPKSEKDPTPVHIHIVYEDFVLALKNIVRFTMAIFVRYNIPMSERRQWARLVKAEVTTPQGADPLLKDAIDVESGPPKS